MAGMMAGVDQRTQLAGHNRLELLLFQLCGSQRYGINVFKVQEVIQCPPLTHIPNSISQVRGVANMRGRTISMIDLGMAIGLTPLEDLSNCFVIVSEYNRNVQGFLVSSVERIVNLNWGEVIAPPKGSGLDNYLTAVTHVDDKLVEIIDVEKVLSEVCGESYIGKEVVNENKITKQEKETPILIVDDSAVARNQIKRTIERMGLTCILANDGQEAYDILKRLSANEKPITEQIAMIIADIEMPNMDGYTLTRTIKQDPALQNLYILLHTSLSGIFNKNLIEKVGADKFVPKFDPDDLSLAVLEWYEAAVSKKQN